VISGKVREIRAESIPDLLEKIYGYDPMWKETSLMADQNEE